MAKQCNYSTKFKSAFLARPRKYSVSELDIACHGMVSYHFTVRPPQSKRPAR